MKQTVEIDNSLMVLDTKNHTFDLKQIRNRRFMYSNKYHTLILGNAKEGIRLNGSHAEEFHRSGAKGNFDEYIRGWIGRNTTDYKKGIIHFAPQIFTGTLDKGLSFLYYILNVEGIGYNTRIRGFINVAECNLDEIIPSQFSKIC